MSLVDEAEAIEEGETSDLDKFKKLARKLHDAGLDLTVEGGNVFQPKTALDRDRTIEIPFDKGHLRLGLVSDTHLGSKFEQLTALRDFYHRAEDSGVDAFVHGGDLFQGPDKMHRDMPLWVHAHGAEAQVNYGLEVYPRSEIKTYYITGNHDDSFLNDGGVNVVRTFCNQRDEAIYVGQDAAYLDIGQLRTYVIHPDGGGAYAKTYKSQKLAATIPKARGIDLALIGHYHSWAETLEDETWLLQLPCFQAQYPWLARKFLLPSIGGIVVDIDLDDNGRPLMRELTRTLYRYDPQPDDYDRDVSNEVNKGWAPDDHKKRR